MAITWGPLVSGPYSATYNAIDIGFTMDGFRYRNEWKAELINQTDLFGDTLIDIVFRGGDAQLMYTSRTYKAGSVTPFWPWGALGRLFTTAQPIGVLARPLAQAWVQTAVANTPAASAGNVATLTAATAFPAPNTGELLFSSKVRDVPAVLQLLPYESATTGTAVHCTVT